MSTGKSPSILYNYCIILFLVHSKIFLFVSKIWNVDQKKICARVEKQKIYDKIMWPSYGPISDFRVKPISEENIFYVLVFILCLGL